MRTHSESRMYFRRKQSRGCIYLQIVESHRTGDEVRQRVIATLGRLDQLEASGRLDRLLHREAPPVAAWRWRRSWPDNCS